MKYVYSELSFKRAVVSWKAGLFFCLAILVVSCEKNNEDASVFSSKLIEVSTLTELNGVFEVTLANNKGYNNRFDFEEVELQGVFVSPSGKAFHYFGFYDGEKNSNHQWKIRFPPNEPGSWRYSMSWSDGTYGVDGDFKVVTPGVAGPLVVDQQTPQFFSTYSGEAFHARGYSLHLFMEGKYGRGVFSQDAVDDLIFQMKEKVIDRDYNYLMLVLPVFTEIEGHHFWNDSSGYFWQSTEDLLDFSRFNTEVWGRVDQILQFAATQNLYILPFAGMFDQYSPYPKASKHVKQYLRYMAARLGAYWNFHGYSITWEFQDILSIENANQIMTQLYGNLSGLPTPPLLTIHDHSNPLFKPWLGFSMRQAPSRDVFSGNIHGGGVQGGVDKAFTDMPVIGSEDIWEACSGAYDKPRNQLEVVRGSWGAIMANVMPIYSEISFGKKHGPCGGFVNFSGEGESGVRAMFDFIYSKTNYRYYGILNELVDAEEGQVASGISGEEYLIYSQNGGGINLDLVRGNSASGVYHAFWFDPISFKLIEVPFINLADSVMSPFGSRDTVLLLKTLQVPVE